MSEIVDIYSGEYLQIWHDEENACITIFPNSLDFFIPIEHLNEFLAEFSKAQASWKAMNGGKK